MEKWIIELNKNLIKNAVNSECHNIVEESVRPIIKEKDDLIKELEDTNEELIKIRDYYESTLACDNGEITSLYGVIRPVKTISKFKVIELFKQIEELKQKLEEERKRVEELEEGLNILDIEIREYKKITDMEIKELKQKLEEERKRVDELDKEIKKYCNEIGMSKCAYCDFTIQTLELKEHPEIMANHISEHCKNHPVYKCFKQQEEMEKENQELKQKLSSQRKEILDEIDKQLMSRTLYFDEGGKHNLNNFNEIINKLRGVV